MFVCEQVSVLVEYKKEGEVDPAATDQLSSHTQTHTQIYIYIYINI